MFKNSYSFQFSPWNSNKSTVHLRYTERCCQTSCSVIGSKLTRLFLSIQKSVRNRKLDEIQFQILMWIKELNIANLFTVEDLRPVYLCLNVTERRTHLSGKAPDITTSGFFLLVLFHSLLFTTLSGSPQTMRTFHRCPEYKSYILAGNIFVRARSILL